MTDKSPKEYLRRLRLFDLCIRQKEAELEGLRAAAQSVSFASDGERVQTSPKDRTPEDVARIVDLEREIQQNIGKFLVMRNRIINEIQGLNNPVYVDILYKRYVEYKQLEEIAVEMRYSYHRMKHLHGLALQYFRNQYSEKFDRK